MRFRYTAGMKRTEAPPPTGGRPGDATPPGRLLERHDWSATPLGPLRDWPTALRFAARMVMDSLFAQNLMWGPDLVQIYNDAFLGCDRVLAIASVGPARDQTMFL